MNPNIDAMKTEVEALEKMLVSQAEVWVNNFRNERIRLHVVALEEARKAGKVSGRSRPSRTLSWCPLSPFCRYERGSLQIIWQLVYRSGESKRLGYTYLRQKKDGGYDYRHLLSKAHDFEKEIVELYEDHAVDLRQRWTNLMKVKRTLRHLSDAWGRETRLLARQRAQRAVSDRPEQAPQDDESRWNAPHV